MKLTFAKPYMSIQQFEKIELPDFTILTGRNGSGKTHLLKAIDLGHCQVEGMSKHQLKYFSGADFKLGDQKSLNRDQAKQRFQQILSIFNGAAGNPKNNYRQIAHKIFQSDIERNTSQGGKLEKLDLKDLQLFQEHDDEEIEGILVPYRTKIMRQIFEPLAENLDGQALSLAMQKTAGPVHDAQLSTHFKHFVPEASTKGILNTSLGSLFAQYKIDQYNWAKEQHEEHGSKKTHQELLTEYRENNSKPWDFINQVFEQMNSYSLDDNVFSFQITNPNDETVNGKNVDTYAFSPRVRDTMTGAVFGFESLSSGETVLAALCVSVLEMENTNGRPRVLLLDEIDASLHPSMIKAMLAVLKHSFIDNGTAIIMATHSPSTVALADPECLFLVEPKAPKQKLRKADRNEAIGTLTEGLATISDAKLVFEALKHPINILSEGNNTVYLKRLIELNSLEGVGVIDNPSLKDRTGKSQLKAHAEILQCVKPHKTVLIVFDSDAEKEFNDIEETETVKKFIFQKRKQKYEELKKDITGIENMFDVKLLKECYTETTIKDPGEEEVRVQKTFNDTGKRKFADYIAVNGTLNHFVHFQPLLDKISEISEPVI